MDIKKLQKFGTANEHRFMQAARLIVMDEVGETSDENKEVIMLFTARDMALGEALTRKAYVLSGMVVGALGTAITYKVYGKFKNRRSTKKNEEA